MSVEIKGFNKPKSCRGCPFNDSNCWCSITKGAIDRDDYTCRVLCPIEQKPEKVLLPEKSSNLTTYQLYLILLGYLSERGDSTAQMLKSTLTELYIRAD